MQKVLKNSFFQGSASLIASTFIMGIMNYVFNIFAARQLGPQGYGNITTFFAYLAILTIPLGAVGNILIQKIGARGNQEYGFAKSVEQWVFIKVKKLWLFVLLSLLIVPFMPAITNLTPVAAYSIIPIVLISVFSTMYDGILMGLHIFFWPAVIGIATISFKLFGLALGYFVPYPHIAIVVLFDLSILFKTVVSKWLFEKNLNGKLISNIQPINKRLYQSLTDKQVLLHIGSIFAISILNNADIIYVKKVLSPEDAGLFSGWSLFAKVIIYMLAPFLTMSYVFLSNKQHERFHRIFTIAVMILLTLTGIAMNLVYGFFDARLISFVFGPGFIPLRPFIEWSALFGIGYVMVLFMNNYFLTNGSGSTYILPVMIPFYLIGMAVYAKDMGSLIFLNTAFIFAVLIVYLLAFFKDKAIALFK